MEKSLYEALDDCTYILANSVEEAYESASENYNYEKIEAMSEWKRDRSYREPIKYAEYCNLYNQEEFERIKEENGEKTLEECFDIMSDALSQEIDEVISEEDYPDIYQTFIITQDTQDILKQYGEITWYNEDLNLHFWGVTHYGTHWSHIMGNQYPIS